jgi:hypothetical protein
MATGSAVGSCVTPSMDMAATICHLASQPARKFRSALRFLSKGFHLNQALCLLQARSATGQELLADDVNTYEIQHFPNNCSAYCAYGCDNMSAVS